MGSHWPVAPSKPDPRGTLASMVSDPLTEAVGWRLGILGFDNNLNANKEFMCLSES